MYEVPSYFVIQISTSTKSPMSGFSFSLSVETSNSFHNIPTWRNHSEWNDRFFFREKILENVCTCYVSRGTHLSPFANSSLTEMLLRCLQVIRLVGLSFLNVGVDCLHKENRHHRLSTSLWQPWMWARMHENTNRHWECLSSILHYSALLQRGRGGLGGTYLM